MSKDRSTWWDKVPLKLEPSIDDLRFRVSQLTEELSSVQHQLAAAGARVRELERERITKWLCGYEDQGCKILDGLREENAQLEARVKELEGKLEIHTVEFTDDAVAVLFEENARLREGLRIYANKENWNKEVYEGPAFEPAEANVPESLRDLSADWNHPWGIARSLLDKERP